MSDAPAGVALDATRETGRPPRDDLVRASPGGVIVRRADEQPPVTRADDDTEASANENGMPTLFGHFTPFNRWTEIDSWYEGNFMERIAPGAFKKTFREQTPKVLFQHGSDPQIGDKPLGAPVVLREDEVGPYYEVPMLDTSYNRDLIPGLEAGLYGASFRFSVLREDYVKEPGISEDNPKGLPERTIKEMRCAEFGPVTFPAYPEATAGIRSMTDELLIARATSKPESLRAILEYLEKREADRRAPAPAEVDEETTEPADDEAREDTKLADEEVREEDKPEEQVPPGDTPTALYFGKSSTSRKATPGLSSTSLYTGKATERKKRWAL